MRRTHYLAMAAVLSAGICGPAFAAWDNIGTVHIDYGVDTASAYSSFAGPVRSLQLTAHGSDVDCRFVRATFGNGQVRDIFSGHLDKGESRSVDVPDDVRLVKRLDFLCRTHRHNGADISIDADLAGYRDQWRRDPHWAHLWGAITIGPQQSGPPPNQGYGGDNHDGDQHRDWNNADSWVFLGNERFEGPQDHASNFTGWGGRNVTEIGLKPIDGDARCASVVAWFANGQKQHLNIDAYTRLEQNRFHRLDLPGDVRSVDRITMDCKAIGQYAVTIQIYANK